jgi:hypothetical protein
VIGNLSWLQFVCYGFWILVVVFAFQARTEVSGLGRPVYQALACLSACVAILSWNFQDMHAERFSPRATLTGQVVELHEGRNKGGSFYDEFRISENGHVSKEFDSSILGNSTTPRPISMGNTLTVTYRVWDDDEVITITEPSGQHKGWVHQNTRPTWSRSIWGVSIAGIGLAWLLINDRRVQQGEKLTYEDTSSNSDVSDIQTLGL